MGIRQPHVQGNDPGLCPEADQGCEKRHAPRRLRERLGQVSERLKRKASSLLVEHQERHDDEGCADVRHDEIEEPGVAGVRFLMLCDDEKVGHQRHDLPGDQEEESVVGQDHQRHRQ